MSAVQQKPVADFAAARSAMVESQIRPNKVRDERILTAMETLPREKFVPQSMAGIAYIDEDLQIARGRYLLEPMVLARLLEEARIAPNDRVLDLACGTGYSSAVLASMAKEVVGVESDAALENQAVANCADLKIKNVKFHVGELVEGWKASSPYNVIIINGGVEMVPDALFAQLAEGGRLMAVVREYGPGQASHRGEARVYEKVRGQISHRVVFDANVKLLPGFQVARGFEF